MYRVGLSKQRQGRKEAVHTRNGTCCSFQRALHTTEDAFPGRSGRLKHSLPTGPLGVLWTRWRKRTAGRQRYPRWHKHATGRCITVESMGGSICSIFSFIPVQAFHRKRPGDQTLAMCVLIHEMEPCLSNVNRKVSAVSAFMLSQSS